MGSQPLRLRDHLVRRAQVIDRSLRDVLSEAGRLAYGEPNEERAFWRAYGQVVRLRGPKVVDRALLLALAEILGDDPEALRWLATRDAWARDGWDGPTTDNEEDEEGEASR